VPVKKYSFFDHQQHRIQQQNMKEEKNSSQTSNEKKNSRSIAKRFSDLEPMTIIYFDGKMRKKDSHIILFKRK